MRKFILILICLLFVPLVVNAQAIHNGPFDAGALRKDFSNASPTTSVSIKSITLSEKVKAAWAEITGNLYASGSATIDGDITATSHKIAGTNTGLFSNGADDTLSLQTSGADRITIDDDGNIGFNTQPNNFYQCFISSLLDYTLTVSNVPPAVTSTSGQVSVSISSLISKRPISAGVTNTGGVSGLVSDIKINDANFLGTIADQRGIDVKAGILAGTGTVTNDYGAIIGTYNSTGTITNSYQLRLLDYTTGGTITNAWGIYQDTATRKNYFNGNLLLGSTTNTGEQLQVTGDAKITGIMKLTPQATPSSPSEGWIYQDSTDHHLYVYNGTGWVQLDN